MSVREDKLLRSLVFKTKAKNECLDFSNYTYHFPGKSETFLKKHYYEGSYNKY